jgi:hypothetical protein
MSLNVLNIVADYNYKIINDHKRKFHEDQDCILITSGDYEGVIYQYDVVEFKEVDNQGKISFNFITLENPNNLDLKSKRFKNVAGDIVRLLVEAYAENENRTSNT